MNRPPSPEPVLSEHFLMEHSAPLQRGVLLQRRKRFFADIRLDDGRNITAHCVNSGRMEGIATPGLVVWVSPADNPKRTLKWTWELVQVGEHIIGANTILANRLVRVILERRLLRGLTVFDELASERAYGERSRVDFWLRQGPREHYIEVKNCHLVYPDGRGYFPDAQSDRAARHIAELVSMVERGHRATVLFVVQHPEVTAVRPSDVHDPVFARACRDATSRGVKFRAVCVAPSERGYALVGTLPVDLKPYDVKPVIQWRSALQGRTS